MIDVHKELGPQAAAWRVAPGQESVPIMPKDLKPGFLSRYLLQQDASIG